LIISIKQAQKYFHARNTREYHKRFVVKQNADVANNTKETVPIVFVNTIGTV